MTDQSRAFPFEGDGELCTECGQPATGLAMVGDDRLCHDDGRDCYERRQHRDAEVWRSSYRLGSCGADLTDEDFAWCAEEIDRLRSERAAIDAELLKHGMFIGEVDGRHRLSWSTPNCVCGHIECDHQPVEDHPPTPCSECGCETFTEESDV